MAAPHEIGSAEQGLLVLPPFSLQVLIPALHSPLKDMKVACTGMQCNVSRLGGKAVRVTPRPVTLTRKKSPFLCLETSTSMRETKELTTMFR